MLRHDLSPVRVSRGFALCAVLLAAAACNSTSTTSTGDDDTNVDAPGDLEENGENETAADGDLEGETAEVDGDDDTAAEDEAEVTSEDEAEVPAEEETTVEEEAEVETEEAPECANTSDCPRGKVCLLATGTCIDDPNPDQDTIDEDLPPLPDKGYRFTELQWELPVVKSIFGQNLDFNAAANDQINQRIASGQLHMLFAPRSENPRAYSYPTSVGQGEDNGDGTYTINVQDEVLFTFGAHPDHADDASWFRSDPQDFNFPVPIGGQNLTLNIRETVVTGRWGADDATAEGRMAGAMSRADAAALVIYAGQSLDTVLETASLDPANNIPQVPLADGSPGWVFVFKYKAERVGIRPPATVAR